MRAELQLRPRRRMVVHYEPGYTVFDVPHLLVYDPNDHNVGAVISYYRDRFADHEYWCHIFGIEVQRDFFDLTLACEEPPQGRHSWPTLNVGIDGAPVGCTLQKVKAAAYQPRTNHISVRLSSGSTFWALSTVTYDSWKDKRVGEFERGTNVIVCPPKRGASTWRIRSNIVGLPGADFHKAS
jgi:hypothetical protein